MMSIFIFYWGYHLLSLEFGFVFTAASNCHAIWPCGFLQSLHLSRRYPPLSLLQPTKEEAEQSSLDALHQWPSMVLEVFLLKDIYTFEQACHKSSQMECPLVKWSCYVPEKLHKNTGYFNSSPVWQSAKTKRVANPVYLQSHIANLLHKVIAY